MLTLRQIGTTVFVLRCISFTFYSPVTCNKKVWTTFIQLGWKAGHERERNRKCTSSASTGMCVKIWWFLKYPNVKLLTQQLLGILILHLSLQEPHIPKNGFNPQTDNSLNLFLLNAIVPLAAKTAFNYRGNRDNNKLWMFCCALQLMPANIHGNAHDPRNCTHEKWQMSFWDLILN